jgi:hypothetical protein
MPKGDRKATATLLAMLEVAAFYATHGPSPPW